MQLDPRRAPRQLAARRGGQRGMVGTARDRCAGWHTAARGPQSARAEGCAGPRLRQPHGRGAAPDAQVDSALSIAARRSSRNSALSRDCTAGKVGRASARVAQHSRISAA